MREAHEVFHVKRQLLLIGLSGEVEAAGLFVYEVRPSEGSAPFAARSRTSFQRLAWASSFRADCRWKG